MGEVTGKHWRRFREAPETNWGSTRDDFGKHRRGSTGGEAPEGKHRRGSTGGEAPGTVLALPQRSGGPTFRESDRTVPVLPDGNQVVDRVVKTNVINPLLGG